MALKLGDTFKTASLVGGVWQCVFQPYDINVTRDRFECYRIVISNGPAGSTFVIYINGSKLWDSVFPGDTNSWDAKNAMPLNQGDSITFTWNAGMGTVGPTVWLYFQEETPL